MQPALPCRRHNWGGMGRRRGRDAAQYPERGVPRHPHPSPHFPPPGRGPLRNTRPLSRAIFPSAPTHALID